MRFNIMSDTDLSNPTKMMVMVMNELTGAPRPLTVKSGRESYIESGEYIAMRRHLIY